MRKLSKYEQKKLEDNMKYLRFMQKWFWYAYKSKEYTMSQLYAMLKSFGNIVLELKSGRLKIIKRVERRKNRVMWEYTQMGNNNSLHVEFIDRKKYYQGRPTIERDSPIDGGVWIVPEIQEAIVVDSKKIYVMGRANLVNETYKELLGKIGNKAANKSRKRKTRFVLRKVYKIVRNKMKYRLKYTDEIANNYSDKKYSLESFIQNGKGVCRHMALLCAVLIEKLIKETELLNGMVSAERNIIKPNNWLKLLKVGVGGHAWCRYTDTDGTIYILDVAQYYLGKLKKHRIWIALGWMWDYHRPED